MSDIVKALRRYKEPVPQEAAARIEELEAALRKIAWLMEGDEDISEIARTALGPEPLPKTILDEPTSPPEQDK